MRLLIVDNYDSFTWNLVHLVGPLVDAVEVVRNDEITAEAALAGGFDAAILSPGPCTPNEAGICLDLVAHAGVRLPLLGVCLGLQSIGQAFGGAVVRATPVHGKVSSIFHEGRTVFRGLPSPFKATRYHSLVVDRPTCPPDLAVTAETADGLIMGLSHRSLPIHGVQFHPESIASEHGEAMLRTFLDLAAAANAARRREPALA